MVSKLLTGFDAPPCSYIYIDKKMQDHTLFQAICRVNRLDSDDKDFGYIVDYMELFGNVKDAIDVYTSELDAESFTKEEVSVTMKERLALAKERIENALETVEAICEPVENPKTDLQFIHYFCGNTEVEEELKANEFKRVALYKAVVAYIRAYANISADFQEAGFTPKEIARFEERLNHYLKLRETIRIASGETLDLKAYEADMRHLIDNYIQAEDSVKVSPFDDISLLELIELEGIDNAVDQLPEGIKKDKESVAETIENNVRSKIVEKHLLDPIYYDKMSQLLQELIEQRKKDAIAYREYLQKMAALVKQLNEGKSDDVPASLKTQGMRAIYNYLKDEEKTVLCEDAIQYAKKDGFRNNLQKQNEIKQALFEVLHDEELTLIIYELVENNKEDY